MALGTKEEKGAGRERVGRERKLGARGGVEGGRKGLKGNASRQRMSKARKHMVSL